MSINSHTSSSSREEYVGAYHASRLIWYELRTNDELSRIPEREEYVEEQVRATYPNIPTSDLLWLGKLAHESVIEELYS